MTTPFCGRAGELAALTADLDAAVGGRDQAVGNYYTGVFATLRFMQGRFGEPIELFQDVATRFPAMVVFRAATRRECVRVLRAGRGPHAAGYVPDVETIPDPQAAMVEQELLVAERHAALREALTRLPPCCQRLMGMLIEDPPLSYGQISVALSIPVGSIGPQRGRCLDKLRGHPVIAALINAEAAAAYGELAQQAPARR